MGRIATLSCFITDLAIEDIPGDFKGYEYKLTISPTNVHVLRFAALDWKSILTDEIKVVLRSMLFNNEWPSYEDVVITKQFIDQLVRLSIYPGNFEERMLYFLEKVYNRGGREYKFLEFTEADFHESFSRNQFEHSNILHGLKSEGYIEYEDQNEKVYSGKKFRLTGIGVKRIEKMRKERVPTNFRNLFPIGKTRPSISICYDSRDEAQFKRISELIRGNGFGISTQGGMSPDDSLLNFRGALEGVEYILFLISENSVLNGAISNATGIVSEIHRRDHADRHYVDFIILDDVSIDRNPTVAKYYSSCYDGRLRDHLNRMIQVIFYDWAKRRDGLNQISGELLSNSYSFPTVELNTKQNSLY